MSFEQYEPPTERVESPTPSPSESVLSNASYAAATTHLSDIAAYPLHAMQISGMNSEHVPLRPTLLELSKPLGPGERQMFDKPITSEMMKDRYAKFESLMKSYPPPEGTAETVRDIGKALIKGDVKGIQDALGKVKDEKQLQAIADYLYGALGVHAQALPGKGLNFELKPESAGGRGLGYLPRPRVDNQSISISIYPDKVEAFIYTDENGRRIGKMSADSAGSELQNAIFNPHRYRNPAREQKGDGSQHRESPAQRPSLPSEQSSNGPERNPGSHPSRPSQGTESPGASRDNVPPSSPGGPGQKNEAPQPRPEAPQPRPEAPQPRPEAPQPRPEAPPPRDVELTRQLRNIEEFKVRWNHALETMDKTPFGPIMRELGQQLANGKLNPEAIQKLLKQVKLSEEDLPAVSKMLASFNENIQELYGLGVSFKFAGKGEVISLSGVQVETGGVNSTKLFIGLTGDAKGTQSGIAGETETDAMKRFQQLIRGGRQDAGKDK